MNILQTTSLHYDCTIFETSLWKLRPDVRGKSLVNFTRNRGNFTTLREKESRTILPTGCRWSAIKLKRPLSSSKVYNSDCECTVETIIPSQTDDHPPKELVRDETRESMLTSLVSESTKIRVRCWINGTLFRY